MYDGLCPRQFRDGVALWLRYDVTGKSHLPATGTNRFRRYWRLESVRATHREHQIHAVQHDTM